MGWGDNFCLLSQLQCAYFVLKSTVVYVQAFRIITCQFSVERATPIRVKQLCGLSPRDIIYVFLITLIFPGKYHADLFKTNIIYITKLTRRVSLVEQELPTLPEHLGSPPVLSGVRVTRSLVLCVCFVDRCLSFCTFSFGHCVVCSSSTYDLIAPLVSSNSSYYVIKICSLYLLLSLRHTYNSSHQSLFTLQTISSFSNPDKYLGTYYNIQVSINIISIMLTYNFNNLH